MSDRAGWWSFVVAVFLLTGLTILPARAFAAEQGVAVVELFTSEGCSSCPPADAALADLIKSDAGRPVYALAFHVDYWDRLGWRDPFDDAAYSERQQEYGRAFGLDSVYTPQAVVNGRQQFVGSDRDKLRQIVDEALATPAVGTLDTKAAVIKGVARVELHGVHLAAGTPVCVALVQRGLTSKVERGENGGRTLSHENVVRAFARVTLDQAGAASADLTIPAGVKTSDLGVIAFAQQAADHRVIAAVATNPR